MVFMPFRAHSVLVTLCPSKTPEGVVAAQKLPELILWTQTLLADAADQINHPSASAQAHEVAGLKSALRTYQAIRVTHPQETHSDWGDRLVTEVNAEGEAALVKRTCAVTEPRAISSPSFRRLSHRNCPRTERCQNRRSLHLAWSPG